MKIGTTIQDGKTIYFAWTSMGVFCRGVGPDGIRDVISIIVFEDVRKWVYEQFLEMEKIVKEGFTVSQYVQIDAMSHIECLNLETNVSTYHADYDEAGFHISNSGRSPK